MIFSAGAIIEIDHLMTKVSSLAAGASTYERLGFRLTPESQISSMGLANRLVTFRASTSGAASFIELIAVVNPPLVPHAMQRVLVGMPGPKCAVASTIDAVSCRAELAARGWSYLPVQRVRREWRIPGEASVWPTFDVLLPQPGDLPLSICQYQDPDLYQRTDWCSHPNTARSLQACVVTSRRPRETATAFESLLGCVATKRKGEIEEEWVLTPGKTSLSILSLEGAQRRLGLEVQIPIKAKARYLGFRVGVANLEAAKEVLVRNGVLFASAEDRVIIAASEACGNCLELIQD